MKSQALAVPIRRGSRVLLVAIAICFVSCAGADAASPRWRASEQLDRQFLVPVSSPIDRTSLPAVVIVESVTLDTVDVHRHDAKAPPGKIFLTIRATSGPEQHTYGQTGYGRYFSSMTPLPASAITFTTAAGQDIESIRSDAINQLNNPNSTTDDGMVDATYSFLVPLGTRTGTITIDPTFTRGVEFEGFVGGAPTQLDIGGPTSISVSLPKVLRGTTSAKPSGSTATSTSYDTFSELFTVLALLMVAAAYLRLRRRSSVVESG